ncbi:patatin-like phospholipase domain-containing protein 4 [Chironomus tepperi]|uniref:patatin-like phospholipase domain-containing protein 4 n=1 Tax=Chironomus tepperi TaxID=113505 RepID=UPI00391F0707
MMSSAVIPPKLAKISNISLSFSGCGFLGIYHVGVGTCFKKFASHLLLKNIIGASAGALVATLLVLDLPIDFVTSEFFKIVAAARNHSLGPFSPAFDIQSVLIDRLQTYLPQDAHKIVTGRLHISLTRIFDGKNVVVSQFNSRDDLIDALACSFFIPGFSGIVPPKFHGVRYMDGAFSDNLVLLNDHTVTVSPFCGENDICPRDDTQLKYHVSLSNTSMELSTHNVGRLVQALIPPSPKELSDLCQRGYNDALKYLQINNLIACDSCTIIQINFIMSQEPPTHYDPECEKCTETRNESMNDKMPDQVMDILTSHLQGPNSAVMKIFNTMAIPVLIPCSIANFFLLKISKATSRMNDKKRLMAEKLNQKFIDGLRKLNEKPKPVVREGDGDEDGDGSNSWITTDSECSTDEEFTEDCTELCLDGCEHIHMK